MMLPRLRFTGGKTINKKITQTTIEVSFKNAIEIYKEEVASLKEHIHIQRRRVNAYREMKASHTDNDLMVHTDFAESYKNDQQDVVQSAYFGNQCFSFFTACCYSNIDEKVKNRNVIMVTERSDHNRVTSMSCLEKVVAENVMKICTCGAMEWGLNSGPVLFVNCWRVPFCQTNRLCGSIMNVIMRMGVRGTVRNVLFRKVKSAQVVINSPQEFSAVKSFIN